MTLAFHSTVAMQFEEFREAPRAKVNSRGTPVVPDELPFSFLLENENYANKSSLILLVTRT